MQVLVYYCQGARAYGEWLMACSTSKK
jgi:hypothetical protein